jgi:hypothetical protein
VDPGVSADRVALISTNPSQVGIDAAEAPLLMDALLQRVSALPGVTRAALTTRLPVQPGGSTTTVVDGYQPSAGTDAVELNFAYVSTGYFETMGVPLLAGRAFGPDDLPEVPRVVIVNETAARVFWGGEAVGKRVRPQGSPNAWREVVGVVADVKVRSLQEAPTPMMFFSTGQVAIGCCTIVARTEGDPEALLPGLRGALQEAGGNLPVVTLSTMDDYLGVSVSGPRLAAALVSVFSLLALMLASLGIYAAVSFTVARRSSELGIRVALGAARSGVIGLVLRGSLITVGVGLVVGFALSLLA